MILYSTVGTSDMQRVCSPFDGQAPAGGNGTMIAFRAKDEVQVQAFHAAALENGGSDEGAPGARPYDEPTFYVAYGKFGPR
ncbi:MAG TPA: hypothetical protein VIY90_13830 [Steroidobacteraceae bacterium]